MQRLEVSGAVRPIYVSLGVKRLSTTLRTRFACNSQIFYHNYFEFSYKVFPQRPPQRTLELPLRDKAISAWR